MRRGTNNKQTLRLFLRNNEISFIISCSSFNLEKFPTNPRCPSKQFIDDL